MPKVFSKILVRVSAALLAICLISSCRMPSGTGFYHPMFMDMKVPDGTAEFKAGWRDGCRSGVSTGAYLNAAAYRAKAGPNFSAIYQHSGDYKNGWGSAFWACYGYPTHLILEAPSSAYPLE